MVQCVQENGTPRLLNMFMFRIYYPLISWVESNNHCFTKDLDSKASSTMFKAV